MFVHYCHRLNVTILDVILNTTIEERVSLLEIQVTDLEENVGWPGPGCQLHVWWTSHSGMSGLLQSGGRYWHIRGTALHCLWSN